MFKPNDSPSNILSNFYALVVAAGNHLQSPLLVLMRVVWGVQLCEAGWGKLTHIDKPIGYFTQLGIPFPVENAWLVAFTETFGGMFLVLGLMGRLTAIPLIINFIVAYLTTEQDALKKLLSFDTDDFAGALPFAYLVTAILVFVFGPGAYSLDYLIARLKDIEWKGAKI